MKEQRVIAEMEAAEGKHRIFGIFRNSDSPCENDSPTGSIELKQAEYIGGDLYVIPLQVYETDNPVALKLVYLVSDLYYRGEKNFAELRENNIRAGKLTRDGKLIHWHRNSRDINDREYDLINLKPEYRIENEALQDLCKREGWFESGDRIQYDRLFKRNSECATLEELAVIIWICSTNRGVSKAEIHEKLKAACEQ